MPSTVPESEAVPAPEVPASPSGAASEHSDLPLANIKEKTPMCLINELARFNKVRFRLIYMLFIFCLSQGQLVYMSGLFCC